MHKLLHTFHCLTLDKMIILIYCISPCYVYKDVKCNYAFLDWRQPKASFQGFLVQSRICKKKIIHMNNLQYSHKKLTICPIFTLEKLFTIYIGEGAKNLKNMCSCPSSLFLCRFSTCPTLLVPCQCLSFFKVWTSCSKAPYRNNFSTSSSTRLSSISTNNLSFHLSTNFFPLP